MSPEADDKQIDLQNGFNFIGHGSLGGKARGLRSAAGLLDGAGDVKARYPQVVFRTPETFVIAADGFEAYVKDNGLGNLAHSKLSASDIASRFLQGRFPEEVAAALGRLLAWLETRDLPPYWGARYGLWLVGAVFGLTLVTVTDMVMEEGDCGEISIMRTFRAVDRYQNCESSTGDARVDECSILIEFRRPNVGDIILPPFTAPIECDETFATDGAVGGPDDNPAASVTGFPWIQTAFGNVDLDQAICNIGANYSDEPRLNICEGTYQFRREWNIIDWCAAGQSFEWDQIVKVGDFTAPEFTIPNFPISEDGGDDDDSAGVAVGSADTFAGSSRGHA